MAEDPPRPTTTEVAVQNSAICPIVRSIGPVAAHCCSDPNRHQLCGWDVNKFEELLVLTGKDELIRSLSSELAEAKTASDTLANLQSLYNNLKKQEAELEISNKSLNVEKSDLTTEVQRLRDELGKSDENTQAEYLIRLTKLDEDLKTAQDTAIQWQKDTVAKDLELQQKSEGLVQLEQEYNLILKKYQITEHSRALLWLTAKTYDQEQYRADNQRRTIEDDLRACERRFQRDLEENQKDSKRRLTSFHKDLDDHPKNLSWELTDAQEWANVNSTASKTKEDANSGTQPLQVKWGTSSADLRKDNITEEIQTTNGTCDENPSLEAPVSDEATKTTKTLDPRKNRHKSVPEMPKDKMLEQDVSNTATPPSTPRLQDENTSSSAKQTAITPTRMTLKKGIARPVNKKRRLQEIEAGGSNHEDDDGKVAASELAKCIDPQMSPMTSPNLQDKEKTNHLPKETPTGPRAKRNRFAPVTETLRWPHGG